MRRILPKKRTSFDDLTPFDIAAVFSHVNSIPRPSLGGVSPVRLAKAVFPEVFFDGLGLSEVPVGDICLRPELIDGNGKGGIS